MFSSHDRGVRSHPLPPSLPVGDGDQACGEIGDHDTCVDQGAMRLVLNSPPAESQSGEWEDIDMIYQRKKKKKERKKENKRKQNHTKTAKKPTSCQNRNRSQKRNNNNNNNNNNPNPNHSHVPSPAYE
jgi:hypothetical protein